MPPLTAKRLIARATLVGVIAFAGIWLAARVSCSQSTSGNGSAAWVCTEYPDRVDTLLESLNLRAQGLDSVRVAVERGDRLAACDALLAYYRTCRQTRRLGRSEVAANGLPDEVGDRILADEFEFYRVVRRVPRRDNGGLDWSYNGPNNDREWGWAFNNLYHLVTLTTAYFKTGNVSYIERIDADIIDWIVSNPYPGRKSATPQWRGLQASQRVDVWAHVFFSLQHIDALTPAARLLMLSSLPQHAYYLMLFHKDTGNIAANEMKGLATVGALWPEFKDAVGWRRYAAEVMAREITAQVYPDGAQTELSSHYHRITAQHFDAFVNVIRDFDYVEADTLSRHIERMWNYSAYTMLPDGFGPMNNDSDRHPLRSHVTRAAESYHRDDWLFIASNGKKGRAPEQQSVVFPWAGQVIMRDGWSENAQWSFFDIGPWGTGHQHNDKLHLSIAAFGRDLLVDSGRYTYEGVPFRDYFVGARAHNVLLIDHHDQNPGPARAEVPLDSTQWMFTPEFDFARGTFEDGYESMNGRLTLARAVLYVRGEFWVVLDHIETDRARDVTAMWHFHPSCSVVLDGETVKSNDADAGNLRVVPASGLAWDVEIVGGIQGSAFQGWYSEVYGQKIPAPTAVYESRVDGPTTFLWVLVPAMGEVPPVSAVVRRSDDYGVAMEVNVSGRATYRLTIPLDDRAPEVTRTQ